jgi:hypothetical protein
MMKSRKARWPGHVSRSGRRVMHIRLRESQREIDHEENLDVGGRTILKWILEK